ncbi:MAG TPA: hypothetical protein VH813_04665 [Candidatus Limnocylindrales bacterium]|jgi:hypothetical protein
MNAAPSTLDLDPVHERLKAILAPYRATLSAKDVPQGMTLELPGYEGKPWGYAAGTRVGKRYVSYYLMGVYGDPALMGSMSPELRRRMQGKSCFNFTKVDEALFAELEGLTRASIARQPKLIEEALTSRPRR